MTDLDRLVERAETLLDNQLKLVQDLKTIRLAKGLTLQEVGERMGFTESEVNDLEIESDMTLGTLRRYALAVGVSINFTIVHEEEL